MHLVEAAGERILLDCGSVRGERGISRARQASFPFAPDSLDAVVLSHAHVDHCGNLPNLVRQGFAGPIYCTPATLDLVSLMLLDSARIQEDEGRVLRIINDQPAEVGTYLSPRHWVEQTLHQCVPIEYEQRVAITANAELRLVDAGHILGSAMVSLRLAGPPRDVSLTFTGDLGRRGLPYLPDASPIPPADLVVCESTYGNRLHQTVEAMRDTFSQVVTQTANQQGVVLIPAFSLGRTQLVVHYLERWMESGHLPRLPLYVDSPLAAEIADVYSRYPRHFSPESGSATCRHAYYLRTHEESDDLATTPPAPCIVVASGGMCEGGRIIKHLRRHIDDPRASLILVSYQAPDSLGRRLIEKSPSVRFHGRTWNKWIQVVEVNGFSGHADRDDFLAYLSPLVGSTRKVRLVHGEPEQAFALANSLTQVGFPDVAVPALEQCAVVG